MYQIELIARITGEHGTGREVRAGDPIRGLDERMINLLLSTNRATVQLVGDKKGKRVA